jgi:hypothetical protein
MPAESADALDASLVFDPYLRTPNPLTPRAPLTVAMLEQAVMDADLNSFSDDGTVTVFFLQTPDGPALLPGDMLDVTDDAFPVHWTVRRDGLVSRAARRLGPEAWVLQPLVDAVNEWNLRHDWPVAAVDRRRRTIVTGTRIPLFAGTTPAEVAQLVIMGTRAVAAFFAEIDPVEP